LSVICIFSKKAFVLIEKILFFNSVSSLLCTRCTFNFVSSLLCDYLLLFFLWIHWGYSMNRVYSHITVSILKILKYNGQACNLPNFTTFTNDSYILLIFVLFGFGFSNCLGLISFILVWLLNYFFSHCMFEFFVFFAPRIFYVYLIDQSTFLLNMHWNWSMNIVFCFGIRSCNIAYLHNLFFILSILS
jgi:hypothetical protein